MNFPAAAALLRIATHLIDEVSDLTEEVIFLDFHLKSTLDCGRIRLMENTQQLLGRSFLISGLKENRSPCLKNTNPMTWGFRKKQSIAVSSCGPGESLPEDPEFTIKPLTLQKYSPHYAWKNNGGNYHGRYYGGSKSC